MTREAVLTFDLEDWFQLVGRRFGMSPGRVTRGRLQSQVGNILDLLGRHQARATFFVLGMTAESCPEVVRNVQAHGHEIASHGYGHQLVKTLTPEAFREDIAHSVSVLRDIAGVQPRGYRAPEFSIDRSCFWAFDVLLDNGFDYDSSIYPFGGRRYGIADFPLEVTSIPTPAGRSLTEIPLAVVELFGRRLPVAGGGYWRLLPKAAISWATTRMASSRSPMLYFHPAEFDTRTLNTPLPSSAVARFVLAQNLGRQSVTAKLDALLGQRRGIGAAEFLSSRSGAAAAAAV